METQQITFEGRPYWIKETEKGVFYVVACIKLEDDRDKTSWGWLSDEKLGKLEEGLDLKEVSTRGISLLVRGPKGEHVIAYMIGEIKKLASVSGYDYFSYEQIGNKASRFISFEGNNNVYEVKPRLFHRIVND